MNPTEEAAAWLTRAREAELSSVEREQLATWLAESPANVREYIETGELWVALQSAETHPSKAQLLQAMRDAETKNVVPLKSAKPRDGNPEIRRPTGRIATARRWLVPFALAASLSALAMLVTAKLNDSSNIYKTARGEQRSIVLSDGSVVQLNTLSTLIVRFDAQQRRIELTQGEAFFRVAHDSTRPFNVETPFAAIRALATEFDVYNHEHGTHVAVVEGKVSVKSLVESAAGAASGSNSPALLSAGQQLMVSRDASRIPMARSQNATAWMQRRIVLDDDRIDAAVADFNRYNVQQIRVEEPVASIRITGIFSADDPSALVQYLKEVHGVHVIEADGRITLQK